MFKKGDSLLVCEKVFELLCDKLEVEGLKHDNMWLETFNNCREYGFCLNIMSDIWEDNLCIWACEHRSSDRIMIVVGHMFNNRELNNMFDKKAYDNAMYFDCEEYDEAVDYIYGKIVGANN